MYTSFLCISYDMGGDLLVPLWFSGQMIPALWIELRHLFTWKKQSGMEYVEPEPNRYCVSAWTCCECDMIACTSMASDNFHSFLAGADAAAGVVAGGGGGAHTVALAAGRSDSLVCKSNINVV